MRIDNLQSEYLPYLPAVVPGSGGEKAQHPGALQLSVLAHPRRPGTDNYCKMTNFVTTTSPNLKND